MIRVRMALTLLAATACAEPEPQAVTRDGVAITAAVVTASPSPDVSAAYFTIRNLADRPDTLLAITSPAAHAALHRVETHAGRSSMRHVEYLPIPTGGAVRLEPGGYHVMLSQLPAPLAEGDTVELTAIFARADTLTFRAPVLTYTQVVERLESERRRSP